MSEKKVNRTKWFHIRLTSAEYKKINDAFSVSTCQKISEYGRKLLLQKPVTVYNRNQSLDDFMAEMILLRNELNALGNNYNQVVRKMHTLDHLHEFKSWIIMNEKQQQSLLQKVSQIKEKINSISDKWLQE
ncbi:MAG: plasmid mobilization relaxosome protein MobC [Bacteroidetes bacterium]|nr:MAG: plasmid mobilization relaxosome protein MobC [Bacteroidota bacterium]